MALKNINGGNKVIQDDGVGKGGGWYRASTGAAVINELGHIVGPRVIAVATNGTTPVNVFTAALTFNLTITGIYLISDDTTAGNITIADTAGTVATIAKGTTAGVMTGASSLANTSVSVGNTLTVVSSSAGNATVFITYSVS